MKIVKPYAKIITSADHALKSIEYAARVSHRSEDLMTETSTERFIDAVVVKHGDWSVVEHISVSVEMLVDRGITHEIVRHRIASYTQESTRFVNYAKKMPPSFMYPVPEIECQECIKGYEPQLFVDGWFHTLGEKQFSCAYDRLWLDSIKSSEDAYKALLGEGWRPQEARSVFPNALASKIIVTMNLRSWRHFFLMRTTKEAHPQIRQVAIPLLEEFKQLVPILFDDIEPNARQIENISKGR